MDRPKSIRPSFHMIKLIIETLVEYPNLKFSTLMDCTYSNINYHRRIIIHYLEWKIIITF
jgi:hypothetical protein